MEDNLDNQQTTNPSLDKPQQGNKKPKQPYRGRPKAPEGKSYIVTDEQIELVARLYNPLATDSTNIKNIKGAGFPAMHQTRFKEIITDPRFRDKYNQVVKQYGRGNIASVADVQRKITSIMENPEATAMEQLKAAELMGRMLGAFNDKLKLEGQLQVVAGVITGVPARSEKKAEPSQPVDISVSATNVQQDTEE